MIRLEMYSLLLIFSLSALEAPLPVMKTKAAIEAIGQHGGFLPNERGITLPMLENDNGRLVLRRLVYFTRAIPKVGTHITDPQYMAVVDMTAGEFKSIKAFKAEWNPPTLPPPPWLHNRPRFDKPEEILMEFDRIYALHDRLIPGFLDQTTAVTDALVADAKEYLMYFEKHAEKPLLPYYEKFSGKFLAWVRNTAAQ